MTLTRGARALGAIAALAVLLVAEPAHAHMDADVGDFYQGVFQPFLHPEFLCSALAIALWATQQEERDAYVTCGAFGLGVGLGATAAFLGEGGTASLWGPRLTMLVIGPLVAARIRPPVAVLAGLVTLAGLAQGHAATASDRDVVARPVLWTLGLAIGAGLLGAYATMATQRFRAFWVQVGVRVAGSWIAAIGLMVSALAARGR